MKALLGVNLAFSTFLILSAKNEKSEVHTYSTYALLKLSFKMVDFSSLIHKSKTEANFIEIYLFLTFT